MTKYKTNGQLFNRQGYDRKHWFQFEVWMTVINVWFISTLTINGFYCMIVIMRVYESMDNGDKYSNLL